MKKIISALIITALLLSSILAIIPVAAEETTTEKKNVLANPRNDQMAGIGPAYYYDYHLFDFDIGQYPMNEVVRPDGGTGYQGKRPYMLRSTNAAGGSATPIDGDLETWITSSTYNTFDPTALLTQIIDGEGNYYDFDAWLGISIRETATIDSFAFYTLNNETKGSKLLIEELTLFGAVVNPEKHTFDAYSNEETNTYETSWFRMTDAITNVQETYTEDGRYAVVTGDLYMPFAVDYIFMCYMLEGEGGGDYVCVELEAYEYTGGNVSVDDLDTAALTEAIAFAEAELAKTGTYTTDSFAALTKAYETAKDASVNATNQATVDYAVNTLYAAIAALALRGDTTALEAELAKYADAVEAKYTTSSWAAFVTARDAATALIESGNASDDAAATHLEALAAAGAGLADKATAENLAALKAKYEEAKALDKELYTPQTVSDLNIAMRDANALTKEEVKDDVSVAQYEAAMKAITDAFAALKEKADMSALQALLDDALALSASKYTKDSYTALASAITAAQQFLSDNSKNATAEEATALGDAITAAKAALVELADLTALNAKIAEAEALKEADYSAETWKALKDAVAAAKALTADATQKQADDALAAIEAAVKALAAAPKATEPTATDDAAASGCGGVIGATAVVITAVLGLGAVALRRKDN